MERVRFSPEEVQFSAETHDLFMNQIKRAPAWIIRRNQIIVHPNSPRTFTIKPEDLEHELLPPPFASAVASFKWIEDKLPFYILTAIAKSRKYHGISEFYYQWGFEESQHSQGEAFILEHTHSKTHQQIEQDYSLNIQTPWELPYEDARQGLFYALFQEGNTHEHYGGLVATAREIGAIKTAMILELIGEDEGYHYGGIRSFAELFVRDDPEGSKKDAIKVASNFRMPAVNTFANPWRERSAIMKSGGYKPEMLRKVLGGTLTHVFGATPEEVEEVMAHHVGRRY